MITSEIRFDVHTLRVREKGKENEGNFLDLDAFLPGNSILPLFRDFINSFSSFTVNENAKRSIECTSKIAYNSGLRYVSGMIESGEYGIEGQIKDKKGKAKTTKHQDDFDVKPFYFMLWIPPQSTIGLLITHRIGQYGVSALLKTMFKKFFQDRHTKHLAEFSVYLSKETAQQFVTEGGIRQIILKRMSLPNDVSDRLGLNYSTDHVESIQLIITAKKNTFFSIGDAAERVINNPNSRLFTLDELPRLGFDGESQELVKIKLGRQQRTIDLSDVGQVKPYFDVDAEVLRHPNGHPVFESIDKAAQKLIADLSEEMLG